MFSTVLDKMNFGFFLSRCETAFEKGIFFVILVMLQMKGTQSTLSPRLRGQRARRWLRAPLQDSKTELESVTEEFVPLIATTCSTLGRFPSAFENAGGRVMNLVKVKMPT